MFGRGRFANRPYNGWVLLGFPFQLRHSYFTKILPLDGDSRHVLGGDVLWDGKRLSRH